MKRIFSLNSILILLVITGFIFLIAGINEYKSPNNSDRIYAPDNAFMDYTNEIKGSCYILTGTLFIMSSLYLIVRLKELS